MEESIPAVGGIRIPTFESPTKAPQAVIAPTTREEARLARLKGNPSQWSNFAAQFGGSNSTNLLAGALPPRKVASPPPPPLAEEQDFEMMQVNTKKKAPAKRKKSVAAESKGKAKGKSKEMQDIVVRKPRKASVKAKKLLEDELVEAIIPVASTSRLPTKRKASAKRSKAAVPLPTSPMTSTSELLPDASVAKSKNRKAPASSLPDPNPTAAAPPPRKAKPSPSSASPPPQPEIPEAALSFVDKIKKSVKGKLSGTSASVMTTAPPLRTTKTTGKGKGKATESASAIVEDDEEGLEVETRPKKRPKKAVSPVEVLPDKARPTKQERGKGKEAGDSVVYSYEKLPMEGGKTGVINAYDVLISQLPEVGGSFVEFKKTLVRQLATRSNALSQLSALSTSLTAAQARTATLKASLEELQRARLNRKRDV